jgi:hypothetical protein
MGFCTRPTAAHPPLQLLSTLSQLTMSETAGGSVGLCDFIGALLSSGVGIFIFPYIYATRQLPKSVLTITI